MKSVGKKKGLKKLRRDGDTDPCAAELELWSSWEGKRIGKGSHYVRCNFCYWERERERD